MKRMTRILCSIPLALALALTVSTHEARAECVPSEDPCAPQKKLGEWAISGLVGFNLTRGNTDTVLITMGARGALDENSNIWDLSADYSFGEDDDLDDPETGSTTRNDFRTSLRYDRLLSERFYLGMGTNVLIDEIADVDYRVSLDPNIGYFLLRDNSFRLRVEGGPSYVLEEVDSEENDYFAPRVGNRFEWAITCTSRLFQSATVLFDASDSDNYLINAEAGIEAALAANLSLVLTARESYDNQPAEGKEKNDLAIISALKVML